MIRRALLLAGLASLVLASAAVAQPYDVTNEVQQAGELAGQGKVGKSLRLLKKAVRRQTAPKAKAALLTARGNILLMGRNDRAKAWKAFDAAQALVPDEPMVAQVMFNMGSRSDVELGARGLEKLIASYPDEARQLPVERVGRLLGGLHRSGQQARETLIRARLGAIGFGGDDIETHDQFALAAIDYQLEAGDAEQAIAIAKTINDVPTVTRILVDRDTAALWPSVEARAGDGLAQPRGAAVLIAERHAAETPDDAGALHSLMTAQGHAGRFREADRIGASFAADDASMTAIDERGAWLVNDHAALLFAQGKDAEADRRFAALRVNDIAAKPWLISMAINRMQYLVMASRAAEAQPLLAEAEALPPTYMSDYARQILRQLRVCSAVMLDRGTEAKAYVDQVLANRTVSRRLTARSLMCAGDADGAAAVVIEMLESDGERRDAIMALQPDGIAPGQPRRWIGSLEPLLQRADVRAAFDKVGRILPRRFWPVPDA